jgi:CubicO group peptidase (beta-lactamase class C family)
VTATVLFVVVATVLVARGQEMLFPGEAWTRATPESQLVDPSRLDKAISFLETYTPGSIGAKELVVVRNGRLIWEGPDADRAHHVWSVTKSVTSSVMGLLIDDGMISLDTLAADYFPQLAEKYGDLTLKHLATMTSPYQAAGQSSISCISDTLWVPDQPLFQPPGTESFYSNTTYEVLSRVLTSAAGEPLDNLFKRRIADRIGMSHWTWTDWDHTVNAAPNGILVNKGSHGLNISAEDAARLGHLFLNGGRWDNEQVISSDWVHNATSAQVDISVPVDSRNCTRSIFGINGGPGIYGYGWWTNGKNPEGNRILPGVPPEAFFAYGIDNNRIFVIPEWDMVVVREASNEGDTTIAENIWATFLSLVGDAVTDVPGGEATGLRREFSRLPYAAYRTRDTDLDGKGDRVVEDLLGKKTEIFETSIGEVDGPINTPSLFRLVTKFALPNVASLGPGTQLEHATLRFYLDSVDGNPTEPVSVFHSTTDNDIDRLVSDHEDAAYADTLLDLVRPTDEGQRYYDIDVTPFVHADYDADGDNPLSAFRLQVPDTMAFEDNQSNRYWFSIAGNRAHYPELLLVFDSKGDFNEDGVLDVVDIDLLTEAVRGGSHDLRFDLDSNGAIDAEDRSAWLRDFKHTWFGDANLDGLVALPDFVVLANHFDRQGGWGEGDFDGDGQVLFSDFVLLANNFGKSASGTTASVPEPTSATLATISVFILLTRSSKRRRH